MNYMRVLESILYTVLFAAAMVFVKPSFDSYMNEETDYSIANQPLTINDLPTVTVCLRHFLWKRRLQYGSNEFQIQTKVFEKESVRSFGQDVKDFYSNWDRDVRYTNHWNCYMITLLPSNISGGSVDIASIRVELSFKFNESIFETNGSSSWSKSKNVVDDMYKKITITSKENAFGWTYKRWFDGNATEIDLANHSPLSKGCGVPRYDIKITSVSEYVNLDHTCSEYSYYQCLSKRFEHFDFTKRLNVSYLFYNWTDVIRKDCHFGRTCSPITLPFDNKKIPICNNKNDRICYGKVLAKLQLDQDKHCKISCIRRQFKTQWSMPIKSSTNRYACSNVSKVSKSYGSEERSQFIISYEFQLPEVNNNLRLSKPFKTVKKQYAITTGITLVGTVGGTLGLFVGFSFITIAVWSLEYLTRICLWIQIKLSRKACKSIQVVHMSKKYCIVIIYCGLFLSSLMLVIVPSFMHLLQRGTNFSLKKEPLSLNDLPTLVFCLEPKGEQILNMGQHQYSYEHLLHGNLMNIDVTVIEDKNYTVSLLEEDPVQTGYGIELHLSELNHIYNNKWQCYKIDATTLNTSVETVDIDKFAMQFSFNFKNETFFPKNAYVWFSSEANSYGLAGGRWFDGYVEKTKLFIPNWPSDLRTTVYKMKIVDVAEYSNHESICSKDSYYQCLAKRFDDCKNFSECDIQSKCSPYSLPFGHKRIPNCNDKTKQICFLKIVQKLESDQHNFCQKSCHIKEFKATLYDVDIYYDNQFMLEYRFELPIATKNSRSRKPFKIVKQEFLIQSDLKFLGTLRGTLGLFIGFSFIKIMEWLIGIAKQDTIDNISELKQKCNIEHWRSLAVTLFKSLWYGGLLCGTWIFIRDALEQYRKGDMKYISTHEPISETDLPTLVFCFKKGHYSYGKDLLIDAIVNKELFNNLTTLQANKSILVSNCLNLHLIELMQSWMPETQCYKISSKWSGINTFDPKNFSVYLLLDFLNTYDLGGITANVTLTSEENSQGMVFGRWLDGKAQQSVLIEPMDFAYMNTLHIELNIVEVTEYVTTQKICSHSSFYQCMADTFTKAHTCSNRQMDCNQGNCLSDGCSLILDPFKENNKPCNESIVPSWNAFVLKELDKDQYEECKRSCNVKEFSTSLVKTKHESMLLKKNTISIEYRFDMPNKDLLTKRLHKTVKKEYLIMPMNSLIGNVGGALRMFLGFSFFRLSKWLMTIVGKLVAWFQRWFGTQNEQV